jgi:dTDP-4-dehydrorhamnose 3,5-epimerase
MRVLETDLPGVLLIEPRVFEDSRGFFFESYHAAKFAEQGIPQVFVQDNHSRSVRGTLRGLHFQHPFDQAKLCRVIQGEVLDVAVDVRRGSPSFGRWVAARLSAENRRQIFIPAGFAHGYVVLSATAEFLYKCDELYHPEAERGLAWNDSALGIDWGIDEPPLLSARDQANPELAEFDAALLPSME